MSCPPVADPAGGDALDVFVHRVEPARVAGGPALLLLHGTGGDENDLLPLGRLLAPDAALIAPRGRVLEHGMPRYFRRLAEGVFDLEDLERRTRELGDFVEAARARHAPGGLVAVGYSNGANIAASLLLRRAHALAGAVLIRPMVPFEPTRPDGPGPVPVLLLPGRADPIVPPQHAARLAELLREGGADVTIAMQPSSHALGPGDVEAARTFLAAHFPRGGV
jgi:phospholipase/carboxylesterase